jgi:hypothetical protein
MYCTYYINYMFRPSLIHPSSGWYNFQGNHTIQCDILYCITLYCMVSLIIVSNLMMAELTIAETCSWYIKYNTHIVVLWLLWPRIIVTLSCNTIYPRHMVCLFACLSVCFRCTIVNTLHVTAVPSWSCSKAVYKPVWHIPLLSVQWITPDDG